MEDKNRTINSELRPCAIELLNNGFNENNCERIINLLQSIIHCLDETIYNSIDFCFFITTLSYITVKNNSPLLSLLKEKIVNNFLYFQFFKIENTENKQENDNNIEWVIKKEIVENTNEGYKEIIQYNYNLNTGEKIELNRQKIDIISEKELDNIFSNLLYDTELTENDL